MSSPGLDWGLGLSLLGHDDEIKQTYAAIIDSVYRPAMFLDVGTNYGTHSVLFLAHGIPTISFEPNPICLPQFQAMCDLNRLKPRWEPVAIGNDNREIELAYDEAAPWSGSVSQDAAVKASLSAKKKIVMLKKLDDYLTDIVDGSVLLKIDVEGFESEVIRGATQLIVQHKPRIIFETHKSDPKRPAVFNLLSDFGYVIHMLPWRPSQASRRLNSVEFIESTAGNFIALPGSPAVG
jgi:FkbM family methyltransferase